jgi:sugar lactone lactonase YvrE
VGIKATRNRLVVAGGATGLVSVYDRRSGDRVAQFTNRASQADPTFLNDVAIAPDGDAYVTDSVRPVLYRIPAAALTRAQAGHQQLRVFRSFKGTPLQYGPEFNVNGIVVSPGGRYAIVAQTSTGRLYRVRLGGAKTVRPVDLGGARLTSADGLVLLGESRRLYVVRNAVERIVEVRLRGKYASGRVVDSTTNPRFQTPTTAAVAGDRLLIVNSQFNGPGEPPFTLSSIPLL